MASIPPVLLSKLYVADSLQNQDNGFTFQLQNRIATGTVIGLSSLTVDGIAQPLDSVTVMTENESRSALSVSDQAPVTFAAGTTVTLSASGPLSAGKHTIEVTINTREVGALTFPVTDTIP
jgi:hypothetical protein